MYDELLILRHTLAAYYNLLITNLECKEQTDATKGMIAIAKEYLTKLNEGEGV